MLGQRERPICELDVTALHVALNDLRCRLAFEPSAGWAFEVFEHHDADRSAVATSRPETNEGHWFRRKRWFNPNGCRCNLRCESQYRRGDDQRARRNNPENQ